MKLDELIGGSIYVDTNVLYMYLRADPDHLPTIKVFLERVVRGEILAFVSVPVLDELFYRLLLARVREATDRNPLDLLREDLAGAIAAHGRIIETAMRKFVALPNLNLVGVETTDFNRMLDCVVTFSLLPRDALHVAIIQRLGLTTIASDDTDFDRIEGLERHWVINPPEQRRSRDVRRPR
ncbi:MAG: type II toxin-antitoxin system VapC family toxin [Anaerolineae bacterium]|jgi:predicted nucleic acid-binding protein